MQEFIFNLSKNTMENTFLQQEANFNYDGIEIFIVLKKF